VNCVSTSIRSRSAFSTSVMRRPVTCVEYGLTISRARFTLASMPRRTALIVVVPEAEPVVGELRLHHDWTAARGVPAHVAILFPFAPLEEVDADALRALFARFPAFDFALDRVETLDEGIVWLRPSPLKPFADLTAALQEGFRHHPPYEGAYDFVVPHLTVSNTGFVDVNVPLPIAARAEAVTLFAERETDGRWAPLQSFALAQAG
jgi:2'-5' RNA ligase superfamily